MRVASWMFVEPGAPLERREREAAPAAGEVLVAVAGCGICHTDLGFYYDGVPTRHELPLTLGHEISGVVVETGAGAEEWRGRQVVVPAVIPCGSCPACEAGRGSVCPRQIFPGNDVHGGFGSHLVVPARGLCPVPDLAPAGLTLSDLSVLADAITTPYQAIHRSGLGAGDLAIFVGAGGVGGFGIQIAAALGAEVVAIDVDAERLAQIESHGASATFDVTQLPNKELRKAVSAHAKQREIPTWRWKIFETSGHPDGQRLAFDLVRHGSTLSVVGFTPRKVEIRLSNLMAFDARAEGNWGCLPEHYPGALDLVLQGRVRIASFVQREPMANINAIFEDLHAHRIKRRVVLVPED